jgi:hypothetical protein
MDGSTRDKGRLVRSNEFVEYELQFNRLAKILLMIL